MAAPPYMKLYVADYLADTLHLSRDQHGAYLLLLMAMWRAGGKLPAVDAKLGAIAKCTPKEWAAMRETVLGFFQRRGGQLMHKRMNEELAKTGAVSEVRKAASEKGVAEKRKKNSAKAEPKGSPNADQLGPYIRHQTLEDKPPKPPEGAFYGSTFEKGWAAYPMSGRSTSNREKAGEAWVSACQHIEGAAMVRAVEAFAAFQVREGDRAKAPPAFHRWLADRRFEAFLETTAQQPTWPGPPEVWAAVVEARGEQFARSWLADCSWQEAPVKAIVSQSPTALSRLRQEVGPVLSSMGIQILEKAA